jgi:hypothetical protein
MLLIQNYSVHDLGMQVVQTTHLISAVIRRAGSPVPTTHGYRSYRSKTMNAWYRLIMDPEVNPLSALPLLQRFQLMSYLSVMWTAIFCAATGAWAWYGQLMVVHLLFAVGLLATGWIFQSARNEALHVKTYRDHPRGDGTARYDDVWGA